MPITALRITDFRNISTAELFPCTAGLNIVYGNNGSGKTSLLEAIHYLGLGRSFRSSQNARLIRTLCKKFCLFTQISTDAQREITIGIERDLLGSSRLRIAEKDVSQMAELAALLPIRLINSQSHHLFESGPIFRRKYLDWGLFYKTEQFFTCWRYYERALKQRNSILRDKRTKKELEAWTEELIKHGLAFDAMRRDYIQALTPYVLQTTQELLSISNLELNYQPGWTETEEFGAVLFSSIEQDFRYGYTQFGPHRADLDIKIKGIPVKHFLSRGQQKLVVCAMILGQGKLVAQHANKGLIYLVDDLPSELDLQSRQRLISLLLEQKSQIFITAIECRAINEFLNKKDVPAKVFHVEHGDVNEQMERRELAALA